MTKEEFMKLLDKQGWCLIVECLDTPEDGVGVSDYVDNPNDGDEKPMAVLYRTERLYEITQEGVEEYEAIFSNYKEDVDNFDEAMEAHQDWWMNAERPVAYMKTFKFIPNTTIICLEFPKKEEK